jgi:hypothetical protein
MWRVSPDIVFGVARVRVGFSDGFGSTESGEATGFWVAAHDKSKGPAFHEGEGLPIFVTNKHVVDPRLSKPGSPFRADTVEIELRAVDSESANEKWARETKFFRVQNLEGSLFAALHSDCAILAMPEFGPTERYRNYCAVCEYDLARADDFGMGVQLLDPVSFVGYPRPHKRPWWDEAWTLPIARDATIAVLPEESFVNEAIPTEDVLLVSGLSFQGSSGSPVFTHQREEVVFTHPFERDSAGNVERRERLRQRNVDSKIVGIMSGHLPIIENEMLKHGGLSYLTRSTSILALIETARGTSFRNPHPCDALSSSRITD